MSEKIWLSSPHMGGTEQKYVKEAFDTNWVAPLGPNVNEFENSIKTHLKDDVEVAALCTGTSAIHMALVLAGVEKEDEVLCQSLTFSASANPIIYQGALPVFIDSEIDTWNMCPEMLEKAIQDRISKGKKPKAIIAVDLYGIPAKMEELKKISDKYEIILIEDAAEALGSNIEGKMCGTFGDFGVLSFNGNKIITTSGGGALVCKTPEQKKQAVHLVTQAKDAAPHYEHTKIGYNYRMSNIVAGIGRGQMEVLDLRIQQRRSNFDFYLDQLRSFSEIKFCVEPNKYFANRWLTCILLPSFEIREKLRLSFEKENIDSRPIWKPMHLQPIFKSCESYNNGVSEDLFKRGLCLPSGSNLEKSDLERVVSVIKSCL